MMSKLFYILLFIFIPICILSLHDVCYVVVRNNNNYHIDNNIIASSFNNNELHFSHRLMYSSQVFYNSFAFENDSLTDNKKEKFNTSNSLENEWPYKYLWNTLSAVIIGLIVTIVGKIIIDRLSNNVRIKAVHKKKSSIVEDIQSLYLQQINASERINPKYITHCLLKPSSCARTKRELIKRTRCKNPQPIIHLLLTAKIKGEIVGFIKAIYIASTNALFIAYVAVQPGEASIERRTMRKLLVRLQKICEPTSPVSWIVFEVTYSNSSSVDAKDRLFRQYGQSFGVEIRQIGLDYFQPDLDCNLRQYKEEEARLYIASTDKTPTELDVTFVRNLIESIYLDVYVPTWLIDNKVSDRSCFEKYVMELVDLSLNQISNKVFLA